MSITVKKDPFMEQISKCFTGITQVPKEYQTRLVNRAIKKAYYIHKKIIDEMKCCANCKEYFNPDNEECYIACGHNFCKLWVKVSKYDISRL